MHNINNIYYFIDKFKKSELDIINLKKISIIYRNYSKIHNISEIINLKNYCKKRSFKLFLANDFKLAWRLNLNGAYIPAFNNCLKHHLYPKKVNFLILGSSHNLKEIKFKIKQGCDKIFLSPIFRVKKKKNYLGLMKFRVLCNKTKHEIIALGGINNNNINKLKNSGAVGFASISHIKKTAQKSGPL